jgi:hypothetical protein
MLPVTLKDAFGRVKTADQAYLLWSMHSEILAGYSLILSRRGDSQYGPKARMRFGKTGFLASLFCEDNLYFINNEIRDATENNQNSQIAVNFDILFDSNAASYLPAAFEGVGSESIKDFVEMLRYFNGNRINWNSAFYQIENAEAFLSGERLNDLFRVALASEKWTDMDMEWFDQTGQVRARLADEAYTDDAKKKAKCPGRLAEAARNAKSRWRWLDLQMGFVVCSFISFYGFVIGFGLNSKNRTRPYATGVLRWFSFDWAKK